MRVNAVPRPGQGIPKVTPAIIPFAPQRTQSTQRKAKHSSLSLRSLAGRQDRRSVLGGKISYLGKALPSREMEPRAGRKAGPRLPLRYAAPGEPKTEPTGGLTEVVHYIGSSFAGFTNDMGSRGCHRRDAESAEDFKENSAHSLRRCGEFWASV